MSQPRTDKYLKEKKQHVGSSVYIGEFPFFLESHLSSPGSLMLSKMIGGGGILPDFSSCYQQQHLSTISYSHVKAEVTCVV